jgi:hypothetical protein
VFVNWHYGTEPSYQPFIDRIAQGGFEQMVAPGALNWNELYPDLDSRLAQHRSLRPRGKASHVLGLFQTVWHDDGETLFEATWYPVRMRPQVRGNGTRSNPERFARFPRGVLRRTMPATRATGGAGTLPDSVAGKSARVRRLSVLGRSVRAGWRPFPISLDLAALRSSAERAMTHLRFAVPPLHQNAARVMALAARRYDALGRRTRSPREARAYYDDARANAGRRTTNFVYRAAQHHEVPLLGSARPMLELEPLVRAPGSTRIGRATS